MLELRIEMADAQAKAWARIGQAGTWWTGPERVEIAAETRRAATCPFCAVRRDALSPIALVGAHESQGTLPSASVEAVHRIRTDSGRLGLSWYQRLLADGLAETHYVELVAVVAIVVATDTFRAAADLPMLALPTPASGEPTRRRPAGAKPGLAWMPTLAPEDRMPDEPDLYRDHPGPRQRGGGNVHHALSLVPDSMIHWWDMFETMYLPSAAMRDFSREYRAISHAQIELLAARVAALNQCVY
jgi:hypothetical protein